MCLRRWNVSRIDTEANYRNTRVSHCKFHRFLCKINERFCQKDWNSNFFLVIVDPKIHGSYKFLQLDFNSQLNFCSSIAILTPWVSLWDSDPTIIPKLSLPLLCIASYDALRITCKLEFWRLLVYAKIILSLAHIVLCSGRKVDFLKHTYLRIFSKTED